MLTKEQWAQVESDLSHPYGDVKLRCDGHEISAQVQQDKGLKFVITVYIDGWIKGEWWKGEPEHVRKFWRERKSYVWGAKDREKAALMLKKRGMSKDIREFWQKMQDAVTVIWMPSWPNAKALCRHLRKTCTSVERVEREA